MSNFPPMERSGSTESGLLIPQTSSQKDRRLLAGALEVTPFTALRILGRRWLPAAWLLLLVGGLLPGALIGPRIFAPPAALPVITVENPPPQTAAAPTGHESAQPDTATNPVEVITEPDPPPPERTPESAWATERALLAEIIAYRQEKGLPPLTIDPMLTKIAQTRAQEIKQSREGSATGLKWSGTPAAHLVKMGFPRNVFAGENLSLELAPELGGTTQSTLQRWLMNDETRKNLLDPKFTHVGVGVAFSAKPVDVLYVGAQRSAPTTSFISALFANGGGP